jgi:hypothetical protein
VYAEAPNAFKVSHPSGLSVYIATTASDKVRWLSLLKQNAAVRHTCILMNETL